MFSAGFDFMGYECYGINIFYWSFLKLFICKGRLESLFLCLFFYFTLSSFIFYVRQKKLFIFWSRMLIVLLPFSFFFSFFSCPINFVIIPTEYYSPRRQRKFLGGLNCLFKFEIWLADLLHLLRFLLTCLRSLGLAVSVVGRSWLLVGCLQCLSCYFIFFFLSVYILLYAMGGAAFFVHLLYVVQTTFQ